MIGRLGAKDILVQLKGDNKDFKKSLKGADSSMGSFTKSIKAYGPLMAASFVAGTAAVVAMTVKMAAAEEVVNRQTESMLKSKGIMWESVSEELTGYINELERLTAYGDTDLQMAFNSMISAGLSYKEAMNSMSMVTDIAYTKNMNLVASADLVSKAYNGQASSLKRYGIVVAGGVKGAEALDAVQVEVNKSFADASERSQTFEGRMEALTNNMDDFKEAIGEPLLDPLTELVGLFVEGGTEAESFGTKIGKVLAKPIEMVVETKQIEKLGVRLHELEMIKERTWQEEIERNAVIFEMQQRINGTWEERLDYIDQYATTQEGLSEEEKKRLDYISQYSNVQKSLNEEEQERLDYINQYLTTQESLNEGEKKALEGEKKALEEIIILEDHHYIQFLRKCGATEEQVRLEKEKLKTEIELYNLAQANLAVQEDTTKENEKQLSLAQKKAAYDKERATTARREGTSGTSSMSAETAALFKEHYDINIGKERINPNIGMKSGL